MSQVKWDRVKQIFQEVPRATGPERDEPLPLPPSDARGLRPRMDAAVRGIVATAASFVLLVTVACDSQLTDPHDDIARVGPPMFSVSGGAGGVSVPLSAHGFNTCAITTSGALVCWGESGPQLSPPAGTDFVDVAGGGTGCALRTDGSVACWGGNAFGQASPPAGTDFAQVTTGNSHSCAVKSDGSLVCWGWNGDGRATPPAGTDYVQVSANRAHNCAVKTDDSIACWGLDDKGQSTPPTGTDFVQVDAGGFHACAVKTDGSLACWGLNNVNQSSPPAGADYAQVSAGGEHACALKTDGSLACWGSPTLGRTSAPAGTDFVHVTVGVRHSCALRTDGSVSCFGSNLLGESTPPAFDDEGPTATLVAASPNPVAVGANVNLTANLDDTDKGGSTVASAEYNLEGGAFTGMIASDGTFDELAEDVEASFAAPTEAGIFDLCARGTDAPGNVGDSECVMLVVYDPDGGFVTGGGWIDSPVGAYAADPEVSGKANFGFVSKYQNGANVPTGSTEFRFKAGDLNFHSSSYDFLVVTMGGTNAQFKGSGTVNGGPAPNGAEYKFMIWARDDAPDTFRIKIWHEDAGEVLVYDNGFDQPIGGGSIVVHTN